MAIITPWGILNRGLASASGGGGGSLTVLLLHLDGTDASTTITDAVAGNSWVANTGELDTAQKAFGTASVVNLDPSTGGFDVVGTLGTEWDPSVTAYTIEFFARTAAAHNNLDFATAGNADDIIVQLRVNYETGAVTFMVFDSIAEEIISLTGSPTINIDTWYHVAAVNENDTYSLYFNGVRLDTSAELVPPTWGETIPQFVLGGGGTTADDLWVDEIRVSNSARYTGASFTPPSAAFTLD